MQLRIDIKMMKQIFFGLISFLFFSGLTTAKPETTLHSQHKNLKVLGVVFSRSGTTYKMAEEWVKTFDGDEASGERAGFKDHRHLGAGRRSPPALTSDLLRRL